MELTIDRIWDAETIEALVPHWVFSDGSLREPFLQEVLHTILTNPDSIQILVARDEDGKLIGSTTSRNPGRYFPFVELSQAWIGYPDYPHLGDRFLSEIIVWAKGLRKKYIRARTMRDTDALYRKYRFKTIASVVKLNLVDDDLFDKVQRRSLNGRLLRTGC